MSKPAVSSKGRCSRATSARPVRSTATLFARPAQHDVDGDGAGFGGVGVEEFGQQFAGGAGLRGQDHGGAARRGERGPAGAPFRGLDGVQHRPRLPQQHRSGTGQGDAPAAALQQGGAQAPFEPGDRP
ncbi:hypothetical protein GCM10017667_20960 [Streptomyces filamentosus]|uniref:Uncharacterized protein n=1 Tax=Streptomyces filamentosus TaxID=67294 RepID=A0A919BIL4_STRFL|nr:hypothetical protein GCM10017667_20960 [Streptomyces filamentosus]